MHTAAAPDLAPLRARLAELTARADARRARDAERGGRAELVKVVELDTLREDALLADAAARAPRPARRPRPAVAPEFVITTTPRAARPQSSDELRDGFAPPAAVPAASEALKSEAVNNASSASGAATHGTAKLPQSRASEDWRARMKRIDETALRASLAPSLPIAGPFDLPTPVRDDPRPAAVAGCGPPGW